MYSASDLYFSRNTNTPPTQTIEPVLGFTLAEICQAQAEPKLTVQQLLEIEMCQECVKTLIQTIDSIYINQPKRFLPLAKEAKKLAEEFYGLLILNHVCALM